MTYREQYFFIAMCLAIAAAAVTIAFSPFMLLAPHAPLGGPYASERLPSTYRFEPKPDITAYELALSLAPMLGSVDFVDRMKPFYDAMPPNVRRHWLPLSPKVER